MCGTASKTVRATTWTGSKRRPLAVAAAAASKSLVPVGLPPHCVVVVVVVVIVACSCAKDVVVSVVGDGIGVLVVGCVVAFLCFCS